MRPVLLVLLLVASLFAQVQPHDHYTYGSSTTAVTLQQPTTGQRQIIFPPYGQPGASIYCAAAQTGTLKWNGTAATTTAGVETLLPGTFSASGLNVYTASNVGSGTAAPGTYNIGAGATVNIDLSWFTFGTGGAPQNISISTTGTCLITFYYSAI